VSSFVDPSGRGPKAPTLAIRGIIFGAALALVAGLLLAESQGAFEDTFPATALVSDVGDGLPVGSDVKLRGVLIGRVSKVDSVPGQAKHVVLLDIKPRHAGGVPASVKARIIPTNIFGAPSVDLVAEPGDTRRLAEGATIPADTSVETVKMQTAIDKLHDVLKAVQPAKLNAALYNISKALEGQGAEIGDTILRLERYLSALNPHAETFGQDLVLLADTMEGLQKTAPALLDTIDGAVTTTRTVVAKEKQLVKALVGGAVTSDAWGGFLNDNGEKLIRVIRQTRPIVGTMAKQHTYITASFKALGNGIRGLRNIIDEDGRAHLDIVFAGSSFEPYTAADCPRYPGMDGPNCGDRVPSSGQARTAQAPPPEYGGSVGPTGSPEEKNLLDSLLGDGGDIGDLLLGPFLRGSTIVLPPTTPSPSAPGVLPR